MSFEGHRWWRRISSWRSWRSWASWRNGTIWGQSRRDRRSPITLWRISRLVLCRSSCRIRLVAWRRTSCRSSRRRMRTCPSWKASIWSCKCQAEASLRFHSLTSKYWKPILHHHVRYRRTWRRTRRGRWGLRKGRGWPIGIVERRRCWRFLGMELWMCLSQYELGTLFQLTFPGVRQMMEEFDKGGLFSPSRPKSYQSWCCRSLPKGSLCWKSRITFRIRLYKLQILHNRTL